VLALGEQKVKALVFMMPLEPGDKQQHFLLSALPTSCTFCVPAGPEGLIEVHTKQTLRNSPEPVKGRLGCSATIPAECFVVCWTAKP
jgi:Na+-translocating ferredoxin:NAD+ oxidoreductase RNF subunit RnfB